MKKVELLKQLNDILQKIMQKTKGNVKLYDKLTQEVSNEVGKYMKDKEKLPKMEKWEDVQKELFFAYKKIIDLKD